MVAGFLRNLYRFEDVPPNCGLMRSESMDGRSKKMTSQMERTAFGAKQGCRAIRSCWTNVTKTNSVGVNGRRTAYDGF